MMCNEKKRGMSASSNMTNGDVNIMINKQRTLPSVTNSRSMDFQIHTNIKVNSGKKMKICFIISSLISFVCIAGCYCVIFKMHSELIKIQNHINLLHKSLLSVLDKCEGRVSNDLTTNQIHFDLFKVSNTSDENMQLISTDRDEGDDDIDYEYIPDKVIKRNSRLRRANQRSKQTSRRKVKRALAAHFKGSVPEILIEDQGLIGPWYSDNTVSRQYKFPKFHLTEGKCSIEVTEPALYFIYAQVYYITSNSVNSYSVYVRSEGSSQNTVIARCSASGPSNLHVTEISCYTAAIYNLKMNDRIFMRQTEKNRTIILRDGHSFFGIVRLNNSNRSRS